LGPSAGGREGFKIGEACASPGENLVCYKYYIMEKPSVGLLIKTLKECNYSSDAIIDILRSIIQQKLMYGGDIQDSIDYHIDKAEKEYNRSR
jgi:hypothetical protein